MVQFVCNLRCCLLQSFSAVVVKKILYVDLYLQSYVVIHIAHLVNMIWITQLRHFRLIDLKLAATDYSRLNLDIHWFLQQTKN